MPSQALTSSQSGSSLCQQNKTPDQIIDINSPIELDPELEIPFHETSVEAMFSPPDFSSFLRTIVQRKELYSSTHAQTKGN